MNRKLRQVRTMEVTIAISFFFTTYYYILLSNLYSKHDFFI